MQIIMDVLLVSGAASTSHQALNLNVKVSRSYRDYPRYDDQNMYYPGWK